MGGRSFAAVVAAIVLFAVVAVEVLQTVDLGGVSEVVRPSEQGTGTKCAEGDRVACRVLCMGLDDVSTITCVDRLARVLPPLAGDGAEGEGSPGGPNTPPPAAPSAPDPGPGPSPPPGPRTPPRGSPGPPATTPDRPPRPPPTTTIPDPPGPGPPPRVCRRLPVLCDTLGPAIFGPRR